MNISLGQNSDYPAGNKKWHGKRIIETPVNNVWKRS